ncbi:diadenosine tetraphosphatase [Polystyrenella longa]|uniref:Diadenosine tetraphosphatase n=1 Tax=Polystyrenella longa TaxID=2528007 RepID=A0A518CRY5_9PLAN|nr:metallophosphoesterase [Polystyrenella longa]QDU81989.1 diadenosine tetraphosphatase [Polystyrenella longa]
MEPLTSQIKGPVAIIGDLHGQLDKLNDILEQLRALPDYDRRWIVFLGDFVDRGPDSNGVIETIIRLREEHPRTTAICGNHDLGMATSLRVVPQSEYSDWEERWTTYYDSDVTFESYGAAYPDLDDLYRRVPDEHKEFLAMLPWSVEHPRLFFVHAGLDPHTPFEVQRQILEERDFTLNHPQWLCSKTYIEDPPPPDCPLTVVSGHVQVRDVIITKERILADTTGGISGELSCVLMPEKKVLKSGQAKPTASGQPWWKIW